MKKTIFFSLFFSFLLFTAPAVSAQEPTCMLSDMLYGENSGWSETSLGSAAADALVWETDAQAAILPGGIFRGNLRGGALTQDEIAQAVDSDVPLAVAQVTPAQLFSLLGGRFGLSRKKDIPGWMKSKWFRYGFLIFFFIMFFQMLWNTYLVFAGAQDLRQVVTMLWTFKLPWNWAYHGTLLHPGVAQFAFGFYSVMLTSTVLGLITMVLFKPRSWCVYCPMGTMTQLICKVKAKE